MKLYIYEHCPFCARARLAFGLKGIPCDTIVLMEDDAATPLRLVGKKAVPILEKDDGTHMGESLDIMRHIDALGAPMFDGPADAALDDWAERAWPVALKLFIPRFTQADFAELATPSARAAYRARETRAFGDLDLLLRDSARHVADMNERLAVLGKLVEGRAQRNISDIKLWPVLRSLSIVRDLHFPPTLLAYMNQLGAAGKVDLLFDQAR